jgi:hypothetical protein
MGADDIHKAVAYAFGIASVKLRHGSRKAFGVSALKEIDDSGSEGIVHYAIQLFAKEILSAISVRNFISRIFPDLAYDKGFGVCFFYGSAEIVKKLVAKLVCNVKAPSADAVLYMSGANAVVSRKVFSAAFVIVVKSGHDLNSPPAIVLTVGTEAVPISIG